MPTKCWKNHLQKLLRKTKLHFFFIIAWAAQTEEFMFQNVAYRPTVYKTGHCTTLTLSHKDNKRTHFIHSLAIKSLGKKYRAPKKRDFHIVIKWTFYHSRKSIVTPLMVKLHIVCAILLLEGSRKNQCKNFDLSFKKNFTW